MPRQTSPRFRPVRDALSEGLAQLIGDQPMSQAKLDFAWRTAVGAALARVTRVELAPDRTLKVGVAGPLWRIELQRAVPEVLPRLTTLLGNGAVTRIELEQDADAPTPATRRTGPRRPPGRLPAVRPSERSAERKKRR